MGRNDKLMNVRVPSKLHEEYKQFCEDASYTLSKRIRRLMENDLDKWRKFKKEKGIGQ
mgnify:CR=1 FL=1